jgi:hypothetical protein
VYESEHTVGARGVEGPSCPLGTCVWGRKRSVPSRRPEIDNGCKQINLDGLKTIVGNSVTIVGRLRIGRMMNSMAAKSLFVESIHALDSKIAVRAP